MTADKYCYCKSCGRLLLLEKAIESKLVCCKLNVCLECILSAWTEIIKEEQKQESNGSSDESNEE
jgi:hypothetical protein